MSEDKNTRWFQTASIYQVLIDRFAGLPDIPLKNEPRFLGGNIKGIIDKIDFLKNMGIDTLWISPFYQTSAYHGYHIVDFFRVEPRFGTLHDVQTLIRLAHQKGMKIIADFVPNHCSIHHPVFIDASINPQSHYRKWFYFDEYPNSYICFLGFSELPKLNLEYPPCAEHMLQAAEYWCNMGFDGFRIDHVIGVPNKFLNDFNRRTKAINPSFVLIGEAWGEGLKYKYLRTIRMKNKHRIWKEGFSQETIQKAYIGVIDGVLDFRGNQLLLNGIYNKTGDSKACFRFEKHLDAYPHDFFLPQFLDNHDMNRILYTCQQKTGKMYDLIDYLTSVRQPFILYYGTEALMSHRHAIHPMLPFSDLQARAPMPWDKIDKLTLDYLCERIKKRHSLFPR